MVWGDCSWKACVDCAGWRGWALHPEYTSTQREAIPRGENTALGLLASGCWHTLCHEGRMGMQAEQGRAHRARFLCPVSSCGVLCVLASLAYKLPQTFRSVYRCAQFTPGPQASTSLFLQSVAIFSARSRVVILQLLSFAVTFSGRHIMSPWIRIEPLL